MRVHAAANHSLRHKNTVQSEMAVLQTVHAGILSAA